MNGKKKKAIGKKESPSKKVVARKDISKAKPAKASVVTKKTVASPKARTNAGAIIKKVAKSVGSFIAKKIPQKKKGTPVKKAVKEKVKPVKKVAPVVIKKESAKKIEIVSPKIETPPPVFKRTLPKVEEVEPVKKTAPGKVVDKKMEQQAKPAKTPKAAAKKTKSTNRMPPVLSDDPLTRHTPVPVRYHFVSDIPQSYGHTYIRALPRDPERVFVYWEISATDIGALKQKHGAALNNARRILRVIDVTGLSYDGSNAPTFWDIEITAEADNWYISVPLAGRSYCIELGYLTEDGRFIMIVRSNSVHIPRGSVSEVIDEEWTELVSSDEEELLKIGSSERLMRRRKRTSEISSVSAEVMQRLVSGSGSGAFGSGSGAFGR